MSDETKKTLAHLGLALGGIAALCLFCVGLKSISDMEAEQWKQRSVYIGQALENNPNLTLDEAKEEAYKLQYIDAARKARAEKSNP